jgi:hypothetical protein
MQERPVLNKNMSSAEFRSFYYLKAELVQFCKENGLLAAGGKEELTERIGYFLDTGKELPVVHTKRKIVKIEAISKEAKIEPNFVCSEKHRAFFKEQIGPGFSFNVEFQKWLKCNAGRTYRDAIKAYDRIKEEKKNSKTKIDHQFEYNTYIRDFFADNKGKSLEDAIKCWKYKRQQQGHHRYEKSDLNALHTFGDKY